jgi:predicted DNA-binding WGR domain protein
MEQTTYAIMVEGQRACQRTFNEQDQAEEYAKKIAMQQKKKTYVMKSVVCFDIKIEREYIYG